MCFETYDFLFCNLEVLLMRLLRIVSVATAITLLAMQTARAVTLYSDSFSGAAANINGVPVQGGALAPANWSANATYMAEGSLDESVEGSAILPFEPIANAVYTLSLDVFNTTDRWVALGFARDPLTTPGFDQVNDRLSNEIEGIAWMLFRDHATDPTQDLQLFAGLRTNNGIADNNAAIVHNQVNNLRIVLDTTGDGSSFTANFFLNGVSVTSTGLPVAIVRNIDDINFVGISYDDATTAAQITVDNFLLDGPIPEPTSLALAALAMAGAMTGRRRRAY
jgi:hypothetical protein